MSTVFDRLFSHEDNFTERKPGSVKAEEIRRTLVAFANSCPEGRQAVLYVGISNDGDVLGVRNTEQIQKTITHLATDVCYPPIAVQFEVIQIAGKTVVAVVVPYSTRRPHFSGPAYVRVGPQSMKASEQVFRELILSQVDKNSATTCAAGCRLDSACIRTPGDGTDRDGNPLY